MMLIFLRVSVISLASALPCFAASTTRRLRACATVVATFIVCAVPALGQTVQFLANQTVTATGTNPTGLPVQAVRDAPEAVRS